MMESMSYLKEMIRFNKLGFDNAFNMARGAREQMDKVFRAYWGQAKWLPEANKIFNEWDAFIKSSGDNFKGAMDNGFDKMEEWLTPSKAT
ncbi:MAG: hypothetical protein GY859_41900 [Desulfobacterales bacterium]|nr:hypothetical protein [Desulfobacterales bacterium]